MSTKLTKSEFLITELHDFQLENFQAGASDSKLDQGINRRVAIKMGAFTTAGVAISLSIPTEAEAANPLLAFVGKAAFGSAIGWYVRKTLNRVFPPDPIKLDLRFVKDPKPTGRSFHDQYASNWVVNNQKLHVPRPKSGGVGVGYFLKKELNGHELLRLKREEQIYHGALIPQGYREPVKKTCLLKHVSSLYGAPYSTFSNDYQRVYRSPCGKAVYGFGITFTKPVKVCLGGKVQMIQTGSKAHLLS